MVLGVVPKDTQTSALQRLLNALLCWAVSWILRFLWSTPWGSQGWHRYYPPQWRKDLIKSDFLQYHHEAILAHSSDVIVIGNPPFGHKSSMAIKFFNHAAKMADTIAFIVPVQWRKYSVHKQLEGSFKLVSQVPLMPSSFYVKDDKEYRVNTEFQIWTRLESSLQDKRINYRPAVEHADFDMWQYNATKGAEKVFDNDFDFAVLRQGYGNFNQRVIDKDDCSLKKQWILFKAHNDTAREILEGMDFEKLSQNNTITPGFGKADVVAEYERLNANL